MGERHGDHFGRAGRRCAWESVSDSSSPAIAVNATGSRRTSRADICDEMVALPSVTRTSQMPPGPAASSREASSLVPAALEDGVAAGGIEAGEQRERAAARLVDGEAAVEEVRQLTAGHGVEAEAALAQEAGFADGVAASAPQIGRLTGRIDAGDLLDAEEAEVDHDAREIPRASAR